MLPGRQSDWKAREVKPPTMTSFRGQSLSICVTDGVTLTKCGDCYGVQPLSQNPQLLSWPEKILARPAGAVHHKPVRLENTTCSFSLLPPANYLEVSGWSLLFPPSSSTGSLTCDDDKNDDENDAISQKEKPGSENIVGGWAYFESNAGSRDLTLIIVGRH